MFFNLRAFIVIVALLSFDLSFSQTDVIHYDSGYSWRAYTGTDVPTCPSKLCHFYPMVAWDQYYTESTMWTSPNGQANSATAFLNFRIIFPPGYNIKDNSKKYPVIIMLHGAGESGRVWTDNFNYDPTDPKYDNNSNSLANGGNEHQLAVAKAASVSNSFPGIVVFPQSSYSASWTDPNSANLTPSEDFIVQLIEDYLVPRYHANINRITMHGLSGGAKGTWGFAQKRPDLFASILVMSGVPYDVADAKDKLVTMPIRIFQGGLDTNPTPGSSQDVVNGFKAVGGSPEYFLYSDLDHGTWVRAYSEPDFFTWIMAKDKRNVYVFDDKSIVCPGVDSVKLGFSAGMTSYQWSQNDVDIPGATGRYFYVTEPGSYVVKFQRPNDTNESSFEVNIGLKPGCLITGVNDQETVPVNYIYPNPAKDKLYISSIQPEEIPGVRLVSSSGKEITVPVETPNEGSAELNVSSLAPGVYVLKVSSKTFRVVKE